jgi:hypothetical protein
LEEFLDRVGTEARPALQAPRDLVGRGGGHEGIAAGLSFAREEGTGGGRGGTGRDQEQAGDDAKTAHGVLEEGVDLLLSATATGVDCLSVL